MEIRWYLIRPDASGNRGTWGEKDRKTRPTLSGCYKRKDAEVRGGDRRRGSRSRKGRVIIGSGGKKKDKKKGVRLRYCPTEMFRGEKRTGISPNSGKLHKSPLIRVEGEEESGT